MSKREMYLAREDFLSSVTKSNIFPPRWRRFITEYVKDCNGQAAAVRAGYKPGRARIRAAELLAKPEVRDAVEAAEKEYLRRAGVTVVKVLTQLANLAQSDVRRLFRDDGSLKPPAEWDDVTAAAVAAVEVVEEFAGKGEDRKQIGWVKKVKLWDKPRALETLAKHLKLLTDRIEFPDRDGNPQGIGLLDNLDRANRLLFLIQLAKQRKEMDIEHKPGEKLS